MEDLWLWKLAFVTTWAFLISLPLMSLALLVLSTRWDPLVRPEDAKPRPKLRVFGALCLIASLSLLVMYIFDRTWVMLRVFEAISYLKELA